jgi:hypothetical protein
MDSSSLSHARWKCQYHIVFIPKYRRKIMFGQIKADVREILKKLCDYKRCYDNRRCGLFGSCTYMCEHPTQAIRFAVCWLFEGKERTDDIR